VRTHNRGWHAAVERETAVAMLGPVRPSGRAVMTFDMGFRTETTARKNFAWIDDQLCAEGAEAVAGCEWYNPT
jgi:hypothetical protein